MLKYYLIKILNFLNYVYKICLTIRIFISENYFWEKNEKNEENELITINALISEVVIKHNKKYNILWMYIKRISLMS